MPAATPASRRLHPVLEGEPGPLDQGLVARLPVQEEALHVVHQPLGHGLLLCQVDAAKATSIIVSSTKACLRSSALRRVLYTVLARCRLRHRRASRLPWPSVRLRSRKAWAGGWIRFWVTAIRCSAVFSCRFPERFSRWRRRSPEDTSSGPTPECMAKAASDRNRRTLPVSPTSLAAVSSAHPGM